MPDQKYFGSFGVITSCTFMVLQVLVGGAGLEEDAPAGRGTEGAGHLG